MFFYLWGGFVDYFIDTEFNEDGRVLELLSLAMVDENGKEIYIKNSSANFNLCNDWVKLNVLPNIEGVEVVKHDKKLWISYLKCFGKAKNNWHPICKFGSLITDFVGCDSNPRFWADWGAYDWVAFCRCFGQMCDLPKHFPMFVRDFQMLLELASGSGSKIKLKNNYSESHNALDDARVLHKRFVELNNIFLLQLEKKWET